MDSTRLERLRDLLLLLGCSVFAILAAIFFVGKLRFNNIFELGLSGHTVAVAIGCTALCAVCGVAYVLVPPPRPRGRDRSAGGTEGR